MRLVSSEKFSFEKCGRICRFFSVWIRLGREIPYGRIWPEWGLIDSGIPFIGVKYKYVT